MWSILIILTVVFFFAWNNEHEKMRGYREEARHWRKKHRNFRKRKLDRDLESLSYD